MSTRQLLIMRHAKSSWDAPAASDIERPLNERGRRDAPRIGAWLAAKDLLPDLILSSPARRTRETTSLVGRAMGLREPRVVWDPSLYGAALPQLLAAIARLPRDASRVLLVAHNPGLEDLLDWLAEPGLAARVQGKLMPTGAVYCLEFEHQDWDALLPHSGRVTAWTQPRRLDSEA